MTRKPDKHGSRKPGDKSVGKFKKKGLGYYIRQDRTTTLLIALRRICDSTDLTIEDARQVARDALVKTYGVAPATRPAPSQHEQVQNKKKRKKNSSPYSPENAKSVYAPPQGQTLKKGSHRNNH